jgi:hypothetical protein
LHYIGNRRLSSVRLYPVGIISSLQFCVNLSSHSKNTSLFPKMEVNTQGEMVLTFGVIWMDFYLFDVNALFNLLACDFEVKMRKFLTLCMFLFNLTLFAEVPLSVRQEYANKFKDAFTLQSEGLSGPAFFSLQSGFMQGVQAGESPTKLQLVADMFYWYRRYGSHLRLFAKEPAGGNIITDEYRGTRCSRHMSKHFQTYSEYGKDPQQAKRVHDLLFGIGEAISGIFCVCVSPTPLIIGSGYTLFSHGVYKIIDSLHDLWIEHEIELYELKKFAERAQSAK